MIIMSGSRFFFPVILLLTLAACTPPSATKQYNPDVVIPPKRAEVTDDAPAAVVYEEAKPIEQEVRKGSADSPTVKTVSPAATPSDPPAVLALLREADASSAGGRLDNSAATLERAIRIQPRNALLWQKLAEVRLQQHQPGLAEDLAKKSNVYAKDNKALSSKNWSIIAAARREKGDAQGAGEADAKAK